MAHGGAWGSQARTARPPSTALAGVCCRCLSMLRVLRRWLSCVAAGWLLPVACSRCHACSCRLVASTGAFKQHRLCMRCVRCRLAAGYRASQRSLHIAPIFRLLLKVAVNGTQQCEFFNFCGAAMPQLQKARQAMCTCCIGACANACKPIVCHGAVSLGRVRVA